ncbi:putative MFS-type transporter [Colletotrichum spinosum]|uniref:Putative MFS-type transporter n=1 Tax=Colletotrichum spinosum TaxID=1347390 RepID=A0A4R8Q3L3_9PEZI|nr:putative MFS-type transporter [Colletotrichum spinosum]
MPVAPDLSRFASPLQWPHPRKYLMLALSCVATFLTAYTAGSYSPPAALMAHDLGSSHLAMLTGITTFCVGFALSPMVLAPLSEMYGRYPVFVTSGVVYVVFQAVCSVAPNLAAMLVARFLVGVGGSVFSSVIGGVIADLWAKEQRNTPMAIFSGSVLAGTGAGPLVAGVMVKRMSVDNAIMAWKWIFWHQVIIDSVLVIALAVLFKESRASVILSRKARAINTWYEQLEAVGHYGVWLEDARAGSVVATIVGVLQDQLLQLPQWRGGNDTRPSSPFWGFMRRRFPAEAPESRLYFTCITATFLPAGLFLFGFTVSREFHWAAPAFGIGLATWGIYSVYLATFNYFADIYHKFASSALAAQSCCRNILGGVFPLVTGALFRNLGEARAGALLGAIAAGLTLIPWALVFFGARIRAKSKFAVMLDP